MFRFKNLVKKFAEVEVPQAFSPSFCVNSSFGYLSGGAFGGNRGPRPVHPEKGVFPLDHMHECDLVSFSKLFNEIVILWKKQLLLVIVDLDSDSSTILIPFFGFKL